MEQKKSADGLDDDTTIRDNVTTVSENDENGEDRIAVDEVSLSFDSLLYDNDDTTTLPPARTWYKDNVDASDKHREPEDSIANWTIKLGKSTYKVHKGILGQGVHKSGYFNHIFLRWTQGTNDTTDLTLSLHTHCHHACGKLCLILSTWIVLLWLLIQMIGRNIYSSLHQDCSFNV